MHDPTFWCSRWCCQCCIFFCICRFPFHFACLSLLPFLSASCFSSSTCWWFSSICFWPRSINRTINIVSLNDLKNPPEGRSIPFSWECISIVRELVYQLPQHGTIQYTYRLLFCNMQLKEFFMSSHSIFSLLCFPPPLLSVHALYKLATNAQAVTEDIGMYMQLSPSVQCTWCITWLNTFHIEPGTSREGWSDQQAQRLKMC